MIRYGRPLVGLLLFTALGLSVGCGGETSTKTKDPATRSPSNPSASTETITAKLSGAPVVPKNVTTTAGGTVNLRIDPVVGALSGTITLTGIDATKVHIHDGDAGLAGPLVSALVPSTGPSGQWSIETGLTFDADQLRRFMAGGFYANVHSNQFPDGELRSQLLPPDWIAAKVELSAAEVVQDPAGLPVTSNGSAVGGLTVNLKTGDVRGQVLLSSVAATKVHLHQGKPGESGPMLLALEMDRTDLSTWRVAPASKLTPEQLQALQGGETYFSVLSVTYPAGELRGQVTLAP
jgi:hypothetical protein